MTNRWWIIMSGVFIILMLAALTLLTASPTRVKDRHDIGEANQPKED